MKPEILDLAIRAIDDPPAHADAVLAGRRDRPRTVLEKAHAWATTTTRLPWYDLMLGRKSR